MTLVIVSDGEPCPSSLIAMAHDDEGWAALHLGHSDVCCAIDVMIILSVGLLMVLVMAHWFYHTLSQPPTFSFLPRPSSKCWWHIGYTPPYSYYPFLVFYHDPIEQVLVAQSLYTALFLPPTSCFVPRPFKAGAGGLCSLQNQYLLDCVANTAFIMSSLSLSFIIIIMSS